MQPDGTKIEAMSGGDEFGSFFTSIKTGKRLKKNDANVWIELSDKEAILLDEKAEELRNERMQEVVALGGMPTTGEQRLLLLLVEFTNCKFSEIGTKSRFDDFANGDNYTFQGATGSIKKYFEDQSLNSYRPTFDVVGPVCVDTTYQYYGHAENSSGSRMRSLVKEAVQKAYNQGLVKNLIQYDHDSNGYVDLVYVITAGFSAAEDEKINADYPWPHQWSVISSPSFKNDDETTTKISKYAFSTELMGKCTSEDLTLDGIGSMCHEFSHALGLPDFYNTGSESGCYGMDYWSVMDVGSYINDGKTPPSYTAYERSYLGWCDLEELPSSGTVTLEPFNKGNKAYIYKNPSKNDEFLTFEYHSGDDSWDKYWGGFRNTALHGMMIVHVDYNSSAWTNNTVNNTPSHQRCTLLPADTLLLAYDNYDVLGYTDRQYVYSFKGDIFPGYSNVTELNAGNTTFKWFTGKTLEDNTKDYSIGFSLSNIKDTGSSLSFEVGEPIVTDIRAIKTESIGVAGIFDLNGNRVANEINEIGNHGIFVVKDGDGKSRIITK